MDLALLGRVLWRFKFLIFAGLLLAVALATLSLAKVSLVHGKPKLTYRKALTYESGATVLITQRGFPWGNLAAAPGAGRLTGLASFYAQLASSAPVEQRLHLRAGEVGAVTAKPLVDLTTGYGVALPMFEIDGYSTSPSGAVNITTSATQAFLSYIAQQQQAANIPVADRVLLQVMSPARGAIVVTPRKKTLPILIFMLVLMATIGLAFVLENLRPSVRVPAGQQEEQPPRPQTVSARSPQTESAKSA